MMKLIDILMILLFPLLDSLPFALPRYWPVSYTHLDVYKRQGLTSE